MVSGFRVTASGFKVRNSVGYGFRGIGELRKDVYSCSRYCAPELPSRSPSKWSGHNSQENSI